MHINLKAHELQLTTQVNFTNLHSLVIIGEPSLTTIICKISDNSSQSAGAGLVPSEITEINLKNLRLIFVGHIITCINQGAMQFSVRH